MHVVSILIGLLCVVLGVQVASHGPSDIQIGIGMTGVMGGVILLFIGVVIAGQEKNRRLIFELVEARRLEIARSSSEMATARSSEEKAYDTRIAEVRPGKFED